jgi:hypothetical protein
VTHINGILTISEKEIPSVVWSAPASIDSDTPLGSDQLNATVVGVRGDFTYSPVAGTVLDAGVHALTSVFTPLDSVKYATVRATVMITVTESTSAWQNPVNRFDVLADGVIDLRDLSIVMIMTDGFAARGSEYSAAGIFPDVNGDQRVTLLDLVDVYQVLSDAVLKDFIVQQSVKRPNFRRSIDRIVRQQNRTIIYFTGEAQKAYNLQYALQSSSDGFDWTIIKPGLTGDIVTEDTNLLRNSRREGYYRMIANIDAGDFDQNGELNAIDIDLLAAAIRRGETASEYDLTGDGTVHFFDSKFLVENANLLNTWLGDRNLDGTVDLVDVIPWLAEFIGQNTPSTWSSGDFDGDGATSAFDFAHLADHFGKIRGAKSPPVSSPWHNDASVGDVDGNSLVDAGDLVILVAELGRLGQLDGSRDPGATLTVPTGSNSPPPYVDVDGDGVLSPSDAVALKELLNR